MCPITETLLFLLDPATPNKHQAVTPLKTFCLLAQKKM